VAADVQTAAAADAAEKRRCPRVAPRIEAAVLSGVQATVFSRVSSILSRVVPAIRTRIQSAIDTSVAAGVDTSVAAGVDTSVAATIRRSRVRSAAGVAALFRSSRTGSNTMALRAADVPTGTGIRLIASESHG
jgi:hypothetical protein